MSIPRKIHYCWFGRKPLPPSARRCIQSWAKHCPDYEIICHNEENFDVSQNVYAKEAYAAGKWAFVSDYARLKLIYEYGGLYLDTDVELLRSPESLLCGGGFMGFDEKGIVATGLGFAAEPGNAVVGAMLSDYEGIHFVQPDGSYDMTPCPDRNTAALLRLGMNVKKTDQTFMGMRFLPPEYLCPTDYVTGKTNLTENTYSIHHYHASWVSPAAKRTRRIKRIIGVRMYEKLYGRFLHKLKWLEW